MSSEHEPSEEVWRMYCEAGKPAITDFLDTIPDRVLGHSGLSEYLCSRFVDDMYGSITSSNGDPRYTFLAQVGQGGQGAVFKAKHLESNRYAAIKFFGPTRDPLICEREARLYKEIRSEHVCSCVEHGATTRGIPYLEMEWIEGRSLQHFLDANPDGLSVRDAAHIASHIAVGLAAIHARQLIHRDIKPANIVLRSSDRWDAIVVDLGIGARAHDAMDGAVSRGGTRRYMSPERLRGDAYGLKSDVYSLGLTMWALLTGQLPPREGDRTESAILEQHYEPPDISELRPDLPRGIVSLVAECLAPRPDSRPDASEVHARLREYWDAANIRLETAGSYFDQTELFARRCVVGFDSLASEVDRWVNRLHQEPALMCLTANSGDGKSSFLAWWSRRESPSSPVLTWMCNHRDPRTLDARVFLPALIINLRRRIVGFTYTAADTSGPALFESDPLASVERDIIAPLRACDLDGNSPFVIAVDGLDECDSWSAPNRTGLNNSTPSLSDVLSILAECLPREFRVVITSQAGARGLCDLPANTHFVRLERPENRHLLMDVARGIVSQHAANPRFSAACIKSGTADGGICDAGTSVAMRFDGNLLAVSEWCTEVAAGRLAATDDAWFSNTQEVRLKRICHRKRWSEKFDDLGLRELFGVMVAAPRPLPPEIMKAAFPSIMRIDAEELAPFMCIDSGGTLSWMHRTYQEFFSRPGTGFTVDEREAHKALATACTRHLNRTAYGQDATRYAFSFYGRHLLGARLIQDYATWYSGLLLTVLEDPAWRTVLHNAVLEEMTILEEHRLLSDEILTACTPAWIKVLESVYLRVLIHTHQNRLPLIDSAAILTAVAAESVRELACRGLVHTSLFRPSRLQGSGDAERGLARLFKHPLHKDLFDQEYDQATRIVIDLISLYLAGQGRCLEEGDDPVEVLRMCGAGHGCREWLIEVLLTGDSRLRWVVEFFSLFDEEDTQQRFGFLEYCDEVEESIDSLESVNSEGHDAVHYGDTGPMNHAAEALASDSTDEDALPSIRRRLAHLYLLACGWTPAAEDNGHVEADTLAEDSFWRPLGGDKEMRVTTERAIELSGGLDGLDSFVDGFLRRQRMSRD